MLACVQRAYPLATGMSIDLDETEMQTAQSTLDRASDLTRIADTIPVSSLSVGAGLNRTAASRHADTLIVRSSRRGQQGFVGVGGWMAHLLTGAACAVAIPPLGYGRQSRGLHTTGVPGDGSTESRHALSIARRLVTKHIAKVNLFHPAPAGTGRRDTVEAEMTSALSVFSVQTDLLVLAPHWLGPIGQMTHPSTTHALLHGVSQAPPLLVTHRAWTSFTDRDSSIDGEWMTADSTRADRLVPQ